MQNKKLGYKNSLWRLLIYLFSVALIVPVILSGAATGAENKSEVKRSGKALSVQVAYKSACAPCHGVKGDGRTQAGSDFIQPATDFTRGAYKFRSTAFGQLPTDADLVRSIRVGMPGTEMVPYDRLLSNATIQELAVYLKSFSPAFQKGGPQTIVPIPPRPGAMTESTVAEGKKLYMSNGCADCHGDLGKGSSDEEDEWGRYVLMISFAEGYYKSGYEPADIYRSIAAGMNGTTMEGYAKEMSSTDIWKVVDFIQSLAKPKGWMNRLFGTTPSGFQYE